MGNTEKKKRLFLKLKERMLFIQDTGVLTLKDKLTLERLEVIWRDLQAYRSEEYLENI